MKNLFKRIANRLKPYCTHDNFCRATLLLLLLLAIPIDVMAQSNIFSDGQSVNLLDLVKKFVKFICSNEIRLPFCVFLIISAVICFLSRDQNTKSYGKFLLGGTFFYFALPWILDKIFTDVFAAN